ncbi:hypothetical protein GCM10028807_18610 [Spirosoma daeguense]
MLRFSLIIGAFFILTSSTSLFSQPVNLDSLYALKNINKISQTLMTSFPTFTRSGKLIHFQEEQLTLLVDSSRNRYTVTLYPSSKFVLSGKPLSDTLSLGNVEEYKPYLPTPSKIIPIKKGGYEVIYSFITKKSVVVKMIFWFPTKRVQNPSQIMPYF